MIATLPNSRYTTTLRSIPLWGTLYMSAKHYTITKYTVSIPIWMVKKIPEEGFPTADIFYDETYGIKKEVRSIVL